MTPTEPWVAALESEFALDVTAEEVFAALLFRYVYHHYFCHILEFYCIAVSYQDFGDCGHVTPTATAYTRCQTFFRYNKPYHYRVAVISELLYFLVFVYFWLLHILEFYCFAVFDEHGSIVLCCLDSP